MDRFPISFRYEQRLKNRNQPGPSNLPELSGFFGYACDPVLIRVVCYTLNGSLPSRYADSITVRLRCTEDQDPTQAERCLLPFHHFHSRKDGDLHWRIQSQSGWYRNLPKTQL